MKKQAISAAQQHFNEVVNFLDSVDSFDYEIQTNEVFHLKQKEDQKVLTLNFLSIEKILKRQDIDGSEFLQLNFKSGSKILITRTLIGFKPENVFGFDHTKVPRVVTTVDLKSVATAIEELFDMDEHHNTQIELDVLKKVYHSILLGAESVGFKLTAEKNWISRFMLSNSAVAA